ncbi:MAG: hypothetical protein IIC09_00600 [Proteobacteria bacterium]|nr:hypothetical protein [Pseudomonadota bacterium]
MGKLERNDYLYDNKPRFGWAISKSNSVSTESGALARFWNWELPHAIFLSGRLCEIGPSEKVYSLPSHPYTEALLGAVLEPDPDIKPNLVAEDIVELSPPPSGCPYQRRCSRRLGEVCDREIPPWQTAGQGHVIACHIPLDELQAMQKQTGVTPATELVEA